MTTMFSACLFSGAAAFWAFLGYPFRAAGMPEAPNALNPWVYRALAIACALVSALRWIQGGALDGAIWQWILSLSLAGYLAVALAQWAPSRLQKLGWVLMGAGVIGWGLGC